MLHLPRARITFPPMPNYFPLFQKLIPFIARDIQSRHIDNNIHLREAARFSYDSLCASTILLCSQLNLTQALSCDDVYIKLVRLVSIQFIRFVEDVGRITHRSYCFFPPLPPLHGSVRLLNVIREFSSVDSAVHVIKRKILEKVTRGD